MPKRYLIPFALILMIVLAACSGGQTAEVSQPEAAAGQVQAAEESHDDDMDEMAEEGHDDDMDAMEGEGHDDDMDSMEGEDHDDDMDAMEGEGQDDMDSMEGEGHDDDMDSMEGEGHDDDMDSMEGEGHDDDMDSMESDGHDDDMDAMEDKDDGEMAEENMAAADLAAWQTIALANAVTGEQFALGDFAGKTVFVEPMATWCGNCRAQQGHVREAKAQLGDDVVFVGLSLETNLPSEDLAAYAQENGFDWNYAVMPVDLLEQLADQFGRSITAAPSTPHFIIRPDGSFTELATGIHSAADIISEIQAEQG